MSINKIKKNKDHNSFTLTLDLTEGKIIALTRALKFYDSPVANDLLEVVMCCLDNTDKTLYSSVANKIDFLKQHES
jgi:hypothetical protein